jgi:hypothetical protein
MHDGLGGGDSQNIVQVIFSGFFFAVTVSHARRNLSRLGSAQDIAVRNFA